MSMPRLRRLAQRAATKAGALVAGLNILLNTGCEKPAAPPAPAHRFPAPAQEWFLDVTERLGLQFTHVAGTNYFMPDQIGSGVALLDFDNDGRLDIYLVQNSGTNSSARNQLFHQQPDHTFRDASAGSGLDVNGRGMGAFAGDVNNDGLPDLLVTEYGRIRLFQNLGAGKFRDVSKEAAIDSPKWAAPASFLDYDRDGLLDIVVGNYVDYDPTHLCIDIHGQQDFCAPRAFGETASRLWRNRTRQRGGVPLFEDCTESSGLARSPGVALGIVCADFDGDRWPDIFMADDGRPNRLFINQRNGTFTEEASARGLAFNAMGGTAANMGTAFADVDADGMADLFITHLTEEFHSLWKQGPRGVFADHIAPAGLQQQQWRGTGFGTVFADFNSDGAPDLAIINGLVRRLTPGQTPVVDGISPWWARYAQRAQLFINDSTGRFRDGSEANRVLCGKAVVGRSLAVGDLDNDGAPDLVLCSAGGPVRVLRNVASPRGHWLKLRLLEKAFGNRDAIGAEVTVRTGKKSHWSLLQPATSFLASNDPWIHIGLGAADSFEEIIVLWPDGAHESFAAGAADRAIVLRKGEGRR